MILTVTRHSMSSVMRKKNKLKKAIKELIIKYSFLKYGLQFLDTSFPENAGFLVSSSEKSEKEKIQ